MDSMQIYIIHNSIKLKKINLKQTSFFYKKNYIKPYKLSNLLVFSFIKGYNITRLWLLCQI